MLKKSILSKLIAKSSVSIRYPMWPWSLLKAGTGSKLIHLSFVGLWKKKHCKWQRSSSKGPGAGMFVIIFVEGIARLLLGKIFCQSLPVRNYRKFNAVSFKVFWCSFLQTIQMFNRLKKDFILVRSTQNFHEWLTINWRLSKCSF